MPPKKKKEEERLFSTTPELQNLPVDKPELSSSQPPIQDQPQPNFTPLPEPLTRAPKPLTPAPRPQPKPLPRFTEKEKQERVEGLPVTRDARGNLTSVTLADGRILQDTPERIRDIIARETGRLATPQGAVELGQREQIIQGQEQRRIELQLGKDLQLGEGIFGALPPEDIAKLIDFKTAAFQGGQDINNLFGFSIPLIGNTLGSAALMGHQIGNKLNIPFLKSLPVNLKGGREFIKQQLEETVQTDTQLLSDYETNMQRAIDMARNPEQRLLAKEIFDTNMQGALEKQREVNSITNSQWAAIVGTSEEGDTDELNAFFEPNNKADLLRIDFNNALLEVPII